MSAYQLPLRSKSNRTKGYVWDVVFFSCSGPVQSQVTGNVLYRHTLLQKRHWDQPIPSAAAWDMPPVGRGRSRIHRGYRIARPQAFALVLP